MVRDIELSYPPSAIPPEQVSQEKALKEAGLTREEINGIELIRRSVDARGKNIKTILRYRIYWGDDQPEGLDMPVWKDVAHAPEVHIIGAGPAGLFAALRLVELGFKPVILERGKNVRDRRRDLALITREGIVNQDSNYCFGEGGAGTYSDGKLFTRSTKRGDVRKVLRMLVAHGADPGILADAHPHIGTNKLPGIITAIRETILNSGGEVHFETRVEDIEVEGRELKRIQTSKGEFPCNQLILATGHSARDIFSLFQRKQWQLFAKPFAMGVRVEHPQELINKLQYRGSRETDYLPPAAYSLVHQVDGLGVYSFCMCPGGIIAPCSTSPGEVVTNGWSPSKRNNPYANSGIVVEVKPGDLPTQGPLAGMEFQSSLEQLAFVAGGGNLKAPAQRLTDFVAGKTSSTLPDCSYNPGITSHPLHEMLFKSMSHALRNGFKAFDKKMNGYLTAEAVVVGVESRTSSPVRIPRDPETLEHPDIRGLYPCGEGAGYAGGIVSAAIDGINCADRQLSH